MLIYICQIIVPRENYPNGLSLQTIKRTSFSNSTIKTLFKELYGANIQQFITHS